MSRLVIIISLALGCLLSAGAGWEMWYGDRARADVVCPAGTSCGPIQHIVIMVKENRTFDSMFGRFPGANGALTYPGPDGKMHRLTHQPDFFKQDISHTWTVARQAWDHGKMDKFYLTDGAIQNGVDMADSQFYGKDIPNYWRLAKHFVLADNFFSNVMGPSFPNHLFTIAAENANVDSNPGSSHWGCDAPAFAHVHHRNPDGKVSRSTPCFDFRTLSDILDQYHVSWRSYAALQDTSGYIWSTFDAIKHIRDGPDWTNNVVSWSTFAHDAQAGTLPAVSWLVQPGAVSDHPDSSICAGENFTVQEVSAVMNNPDLWAHTAFIVTWDDWGGLYDHVPPPVGPNKNIMYGFRVPALIISPYVQAGKVDHTLYSFSSMLRFVEDIFHLPSLNDVDGKSNGLQNAFDYQQAPLPPLPLKQRTCPPIPPSEAPSPTNHSTAPVAPARRAVQFPS